MKREIPLPDKIEEYRLSLGSTMISQESKLDLNKYKTKASKIKFAETSPASFDQFKLKNEIEFAKTPDSVETKDGLDIEENDEYSTLTLTTDYLSNSIGIDGNKSPGNLSMKKKIGKWAVYGEFERKKLIPILMPSPLSDLQLKTLGSIRDNSSSNKSISAGNTQEKPNQSDKNSALSSRYYLEAVYNFLPTVKGKLSYKRSMIDTYDSEEKLQVEGIVEANKNMLIKAGYNNESRPEVNEPKSTNDSKVWTEFILKF
jgi:hypothetical protein